MPATRACDHWSAETLLALWPSLRRDALAEASKHNACGRGMEAARLTMLVALAELGHESLSAGAGTAACPAPEPALAC